MDMYWDFHAHTINLPGRPMEYQSYKNVNYARPPFFVDDTRLPVENRIGSETFGGGGYDLGHMVPNAAINEQYGKLSQMETFLMSNVSPQKAELNRGVWVKLEEEIRGDYFGDADHVDHSIQFSRIF